MLLCNSGTTWTQQIVHLLLRKGAPGGFYSESVPWLEAVCSDMLISREAPTWTLDKINLTSGRRYFKTHATVDHLPGIDNYSKMKSCCISDFTDSINMILDLTSIHTYLYIYT